MTPIIAKGDLIMSSISITYKDYYSNAHSIEKLKDMALRDIEIAIFLGANPDRIKAIEDAMNERAEEIERESNKEEV